MSVPDTQPVEAAFHYCPSCGEARDGGGDEGVDSEAVKDAVEQVKKEIKEHSNK